MKHFAIYEIKCNFESATKFADGKESEDRQQKAEPQMGDEDGSSGHPLLHLVHLCGLAPFSRVCGKGEGENLLRNLELSDVVEKTRQNQAALFLTT